MVFTTLRFIVFMMVVFTLYYIIPQKKQWILLLIASYIFYFNASLIFPLVLFAITVVTYVFAVTVDKSYEERDEYLGRMKHFSREEKEKYRKSVSDKLKPLFIILLFLLILTLCIFKYADFIFNNVIDVNAFLDNTTVKPKVNFNIIMPLGISFYMFQSLGYCIDVYTEAAKAERNFFKHALFVAFFPTLLQGPIERYEHLSAQLFSGVTFSYQNAKYGIQRAAWGFFKKLVIANQISVITDDIWANYGNYNGLVFWIFMLILYAIWIYADFSGYVDIALGCSKMLGIELAENFNAPYFSKSIAIYWRRWHITLGAWFKNYVFYPVLRIKFCENFRKKYRKKNKYLSNLVPNMIALSTVWILIGIWHGADWAFVLHGVYHGGIIIFSTAMAPLYEQFNCAFPKLVESKPYNGFRMVRTFSLVTMSYLLFKSASLDISLSILRQMSAGSGTGELINFIAINLKVMLEIGVGVILFLISDIYQYKNEGKNIIEKVDEFKKPVRWIIYVSIILLTLILGVYGKSSLNQFAYFRF